MLTSPWPKNFVLRALAFIWTLPNAPLGLIPLLLLGPWVESIDFKAGAFDVVVGGWPARLFKYTKMGAITLWIFCFYAGKEYLFPRKQQHERRHVWHQIIFGVLFYPGYLVLYAFYPHKENPLEEDARDHDGD